jgi:hypothetical protein
MAAPWTGTPVDKSKHLSSLSGGRHAASVFDEIQGGALLVAHQTIQALVSQYRNLLVSSHLLKYPAQFRRGSYANSSIRVEQAQPTSDRVQPSLKPVASKHW